MRLFLAFIYFLGLIMVLNGRPFVRKNRVLGQSVLNTLNEQGSTGNVDDAGNTALVRAVRRKRAFQHGFNKV